MYYQNMFYKGAYRNPLNNKGGHYLEVLGEGRVSAVPDTVIIRLGVITDDKELTVALNNNSAAMQNILDSLRNLGIPQENIQTDEYRIDIQYDYIDGKQIFRGYRVTNMIQVTLEDVSQAGVVVDTAVQSGANTVSQIQFTVANQEEFYNQALTLAVKNAQNKANTIASAARVSISQTPYLISEFIQTQQPPIPYETTALVKGVATPPIEAGEVEITAKVQAKFLIL